MPEIRYFLLNWIRSLSVDMLQEATLSAGLSREDTFLSGATVTMLQECACLLRHVPLPAC
jgi:hypothetical protein